VVLHYRWAGGDVTFQFRAVLRRGNDLFAQSGVVILFGPRLRDELTAAM
jgi:hypothetical protein